MDIHSIDLTFFSAPTTKVIPAPAANCTLLLFAVTVAPTKAYSLVFASQILTCFGLSHHNFFCIHYNNSIRIFPI
ncbi:defensin protein [Trifolium repens]|nr:defensin protein [Trifolium repens]